MEEITKEYLLLFNTITDAQEKIGRVRTELVWAQQLAEELYLQGQEANSLEDATA